jgi:hypothetical protein
MLNQRTTPGRSSRTGQLRLTIALTAVMVTVSGLAAGSADAASSAGPAPAPAPLAARAGSVQTGDGVLASAGRAVAASAVVPAVSAVPVSGLAAAPAAYASGLPWSSGAYTVHSASSATAFAKWRGRPLDNLSLFPRRDSWATINQSWYLSSTTIPAGFTGDLVVAVPLWPQDSSVSVNANGQWRTFARALAAKDSDAYVRLGWEMNIKTPWGVTPANRAQWVNAFKRAVIAMHSVAPQLRIVFNPNWGYDQSGVDSHELFQQVKSGVSVYAIDMYDAYPPDTNDWNAVVRWFGARGLADSLDFAKANGVKFALGEWGVACNGPECQWAGNTGGDNPRYIQETLNFLSRYSANVAFESYFNEPATYIKSHLYPANVNPVAGQAYRTALTQYAVAAR